MPEYSRTEMTIGQLQATHPLYDANLVFWNFMLASYEGIRALIDGGYVLERHERETVDNFNRRVKEAYGLGYSASVVDLFNFYLFKEPVTRDMGPLARDKQWELFEKDADLHGTSFETFLLESQRYAGIMGHVGLLLDKSPVKYSNRGEEIKRKVYPYAARYFPQNIMDWEYARDEDNRPYLAYIKLVDEDGSIRIWTTEWWAVYVIPEELQQTTVKDADTGETRGGGTTGDETHKVKPQNTGDNPFMGEGDGERGEIPFIWFYNIKSKDKGIGISDIKDVAYMDGSIIRNCSGGEEVITYGAFPMLRKPMKEAGGTGKGDDDAGATAVLEFDPDLGDAGKPDWLESAVAEPIDAILKWIAMKVGEIYRATNIGGMAATEIQTQAKSGVALKSEFQLLNGKLVAKGNNAEKTETDVKKYWGMWQKRTEEEMAKVTTEWPESYDVENLAQDLENALTAKALVQSKTFLAAIQKQIARSMLPNADNELLSDIDDEIEDAAEKETAQPGIGAGGEKEISGGGTEPGKLVPIPGGQQAGGTAKETPAQPQAAAAGGE